MISNILKSKDFTGHNIYAGIDTHYKSWMVSIYSDEFELKTFSQPPDVDLLEKYLKKNYPGANYHLAYEAGFCGFWIQRSFTQKGIRCDVIHPADVPTSDKESKRKSDKVDSRKIAKGLKNGELNTIYIPDECQEADRLLLRTRTNIVRDVTMVKNRIKAFLKINGIAVPNNHKNGNWTKSFITWLHSLTFAEAAGKTSFDVYVNEATFLIEREKQLRGTIEKLSISERYASNMKLLLSIPSIGLIAAMTILTEIGNITRFKKQDHLSSYCGLTPNSHNSGEAERVGGLSRRGNPFIKTILIECAWMAIRKDPALLLYYKQLLPRMNANKAIVKVTRKLLCRIRYVLLSQKEYVTGVIK
jgi:transposase